MHAGPPGPTLAHARRVVCYHCREPLDVAPKAQTITCPLCYKPLAVADIVVKDTHWGGRLQSCGAILVKPRARVMAKRVLAVQRVEILGDVQGDIECLGLVIVGPRGVCRGSISASALVVAEGARLECPELRIDPALAQPGAADSDHQPASGPQDLPGVVPEAAETAAAPTPQARDTRPDPRPACEAVDALARSRDAGSAPAMPRLALGRRPIVQVYTRD